VNEWPEPVTESFSPAAAAAPTASASSSRERGARIRAGRQRWSPAQFAHSPCSVMGPIFYPSAGSGSGPSERNA
jgi:hypothetical protein